MIVYNKLIRDKIPEIIEADGKTYKVHVADQEAYKTALKAKLLEESREFLSEPSLEELADVLEIIDAIKKAFDFDEADLRRVKDEKRNLRGGFDKQLILEYVEAKK